MSLLLDALKRAEQEKLARQAANAALAESAAAEAAPAAKPGLELESLEAARHAAPAAAATPGERANAQAMFAAKADARSRGSGARLPLMLAAGAIGVLVLAAGAYVWFQINALGPKPYTAREQRQASRPPAAAAAPVPTAPFAMPPAAPVPAPASGIAPTNPAAPPVALFRPEAVSPETRKARPPAAAAEKLVLALLQESPARAPSPPLKLTRSIEPPRVQPEIAAGYEALRRGDLANARRSYQAALALDPNSIDALLGVATVEARSGERSAAARDYRRVLALDGRNTTALAGLAAVADFSRPEALEPSLKGDIARYPQSAALHMTLGNLYASQSRWSEAQGAFFEAHRLEPANADVLYNLAVALDNLGQPKLAADFYRRSLAQAKGMPVQFDARAAERRLADLKN